MNTLLKKRLNISEVQYAAAPAAAAATPVAAAEEPAAEVVEEEPVKVQTEFTLVMTGFDESKKVKSKLSLFILQSVFFSARISFYFFSKTVIDSSNLIFGS